MLRDRQKVFDNAEQMAEAFLERVAAAQENKARKLEGGT